ncbi:xylan 1,4-beta-xylosidase [Catenibacillus scindens]|uniref:Xylan 1,4-beta-xylosidase n=2 Tax=Catenibacillus scindens TaxID=673271 RepID=A0A7W8H9H4_9FIRM|nr:helix-turn-helix domain-containing protein [Catenibacillus scindens]MBB5264272.1 xylan 1,4-beta-xylosidase [Catenibacillus scindens]
MNRQAQSPFKIAVCDKYPQTIEMNQAFTIIAVLRGKIHLLCNQEEHELSEGMLFLLKPQDYFSTKIDKVPPSAAAFISFQYNFFLKNIPYAIDSLDLDPKNYPQETYDALFFRTVDFIDKYFTESEDPDAFRNLNAYDYVCFLQGLGADRPNSPVSSDKKAQRIFHIKDFIERNYASSITLNDLAEELKITPQYLASFMRRHMGMTFNQFLYKVRLSYAVRDLVNTTESITHIAFNYGFPNLASFNRIFKNVYKKTPLNYRMQYKKNMAYLDILPPDIYDYEKSKGVYRDCRIKNPEGSAYPVELSIENTLDAPLSHVWSRILNVGYGKELNDFILHEHIASIMNHFSFEYGRIYGLFHPDLIPYNESDRTWNFHQVDTLLDILKYFRLKPFIVLGKPEPVFGENGQPVYTYTNQDFPDFSRAFKAFMNHCLHRYGIESVEQWIFEYSYNMVEEGYFSKNQFYYTFLKNSADAYRILKSISPAIIFGGPGHRMAQNPQPLFHLLNCWRQEGISPDFITVNAYAMERTPLKPLPSRHKYSTDPTIHRRHLIELQTALKKFYQKDLPVYVIELGFTFMIKRYFSDSRFSACYILQNMLDLCDLCQGIALPVVSDLHYLRLGISRLLCGGNGILSPDGIRKPAFFALMFLHNLGQELYAKGPGYVITHHKDHSFRLLLWNYKHPNNYFCAHYDYQITADNFEHIYTNDRLAEYHLRLGHLKAGKYFIVDYALTKDHGSILDKWLQCGVDVPLLPHIIAHLKEHTDVDFSYRVLTVSSDTLFHYMLEPHIIKMISIFPAN